MLALLLTLVSSVRPVDDALLSRVGAGDQNAFAELYETAKDSVYGFALSLVRNTHDAEDVLQETMLTVYEKARLYTPTGKPMAWILTIAKRKALDKLREKQKEGTHSEYKLESLVTLEDHEERLLLEGLLGMLTNNERQIVMLHAISGLKHREIASLLDIPLGSVLSTYHRAIKRLQALSKEGCKDA